MDYQVPQFIEVEDKIFGPLTLKQFIYLAGGVGICAIIFLYVPLIFAILLVLPVAGLALALAFYKINGKPFIDVLEAGVSYFLGRRLYIWKKENRVETPTVAPTERPSVSPTQQTSGLTRKKLEELAWSLDVKAPPSDFK